MSDEEEESLSEGFSASEDEWKPNKDARGGESSDDDDSDFEQPLATVAAAGSIGRSATVAKKKEQKPPSGIKGASVRKRKPSGQSLRSKLYNKYRPPPKTFPTSPTQNSPSASSSNRVTASKNAKTPNESDARNADSSSESSVEDYLVNPADIDLQSTFFAAQPAKEKSPAPQFDCNAGITNLYDSGSEDNNESSIEDNATKAFDFRSLLENANSLERAKDALAKRAVTAIPPTQAAENAATMDVNALLALGENQNYANEPEEDDKGEERQRPPPPMDGPSCLNKTKSTRIKRHTKTRPASTVVTGGDTDDSDWEEVAGADGQSTDDPAPTVCADLEIHVGLPSRHATKEQKTQHELELALKRRMNRNIKERQLLLHKVSLMSLIARSYKYNQLLSDTALMEATLKLLPSKNAYPTQRGTELKYLQSFVTWFKTAIKLLSANLYPEKTAKSKKGIVEELLAQIKRKEARCKQDMICIFIALARGMGMHCRLVVNMQPLPLRPAASDLIPIKLKQEDSTTGQNQKSQVSSNTEDGDAELKSVKPTKLKSSIKTTTDKSSAKAKPEAATKTKDTVKSSSSKRAEENAETVPSVNCSPKAETVKAAQKSTESNNSKAKPQLSRLKRATAATSTTDASKKPKLSGQASLNIETCTPVARRTRKASSDKMMVAVQIGSPVLPKLVLQSTSSHNTKRSDAEKANLRDSRGRRSSESIKLNLSSITKDPETSSSANKTPPTRQLRTRQQKCRLGMPQLDGADDSIPVAKKRPKLEKLQKSHSLSESDGDFEPPPSKPVKKSPMLPKAVQRLRQDRRVLSTDDESGAEAKRKATGTDMWVEMWSEVEEQWICVDLFKGKLHCVDTIRRSASSNLAYVFAFQDDLSMKDVTARYCPSWTVIVRKGRVEKAWLDETIAPYLGRRTKRDIVEDQQLRRIHEEKPVPKSISEFKDHPLYVLERHLLKFQGLYPPDAPTLGFIRGEPIYARECVHLLHSREIWLKSARVVKLGEQPYKIVKARPKWDKLTRTVIKDQPLEIFGYWQTQDYEPPTAENGIVPRNAYGNVELFKACMLPKKTVHLRLPGLMRVCKKLNIDCVNAVIGFDFHQGACHPMFDGFVVCEEFQDQVTAAWYQDQEEQARKDQEKYEARVYGNWKKLIKGLLIRERLKKKYNF